MEKLKVSKNFIKHMVTTGIIDWPSKTYLIVVIKDNEGDVIWRRKYETLPSQTGFSVPNENHTEFQMLEDEDFRNCLEEEMVGEIILMSNYSPCRNCADDLIKFHTTDSPDLKLTIRFLHIYNTNDAEDHLAGLKDLHNAGITLETMTEKSRLEVLEFMFNLDPGALGKKDDATRKELEELLKSDSEDEDENIVISTGSDSD